MAISKKQDYLTMYTYFRPIHPGLTTYLSAVAFAKVDDLFIPHLRLMTHDLHIPYFIPFYTRLYITKKHITYAYSSFHHISKIIFIENGHSPEIIP